MAIHTSLHLTGHFCVFSFSKYTHERKTANLGVPYFVKEDFMKDNRGGMRRIEQNVEEDYVGNLRSNCFRERSYSKYNQVQCT